MAKDAKRPTDMARREAIQVLCDFALYLKTLRPEGPVTADDIDRALGVVADLTR